MDGHFVGNYSARVLLVILIGYLGCKRRERKHQVAKKGSLLHLTLSIAQSRFYDSFHFNKASSFGI